jgi:hypothetical protein
LFLKSPPWNPLLADLITATLFLPPQGSMLFTVPSSKQPLPSGAKQATYTTHSWDFRPRRHRRPPLPNTHNSLTPGSITAVGGPGLGPVGLLWWTRAPSRT